MQNLAFYIRGVSLFATSRRKTGTLALATIASVVEHAKKRVFIKTKRGIKVVNKILRNTEVLGAPMKPQSKLSNYKPFGT